MEKGDRLQVVFDRFVLSIQRPSYGMPALALSRGNNVRTIENQMAPEPVQSLALKAVLPALVVSADGLGNCLQTLERTC